MLSRLIADFPLFVYDCYLDFRMVSAGTSSCRCHRAGGVRHSCIPCHCPHLLDISGVSFPNTNFSNHPLCLEVHKEIYYGQDKRAVSPGWLEWMARGDTLCDTVGELDIQNLHRSRGYHFSRSAAAHHQITPGQTPHIIRKLAIVEHIQKLLSFRRSAQFFGTPKSYCMRKSIGSYQ